MSQVVLSLGASGGSDAADLAHVSSQPDGLTCQSRSTTLVAVAATCAMTGLNDALLWLAVSVYRSEQGDVFCVQYVYMKGPKC